MAFGLSAGAVAAIGAVAPSVIGAITSDGASSAGQGGAQQASGITAAQYEETKRRISPYSENGLAGSNRLAQLLGTASNSDPGYMNIHNRLYGEYDTKHQNQYGMSLAQANNPAAFAGIAKQAQEEYAASPEGQNSQFGELLKKYTGKDLLNDPGYEFRRSEGQKGVERSAAGRGGLFSGQAGKELERYNQGFASNEFQNGFNRDQAYKGQTYGMLSGQAAQGLNAEGVLANTGANAASRQAEYATQGANADASGMVGVGNAINSGIGNYQNYNMLNSLFNKTVQGGGSSSAYDPVAGYGFGNLGSGS